jgi:hypothetical protein
MTSTVLLKRGKNDGIAAYFPKETKLSQNLFFDLVRELSDTPRIKTQFVPHRKHICVAKPNRLMLFRETVADYCENHTEHINTLCGQNAEF